MKPIIRSYLLVLVAFISIMGCTEEEVLPPPPTTIVANVSSQRATIGIPITFTDNSIDVLSRTWTFPGGTPSSSTEKELSVIFNEEGTYVCSLEVSFDGGITNSKDLTIVVAPQEAGFANKYIFSFENEAVALASWKSWSPEATSPATLSVDPSQGANGTSSSGKVSFTASGKEIQIFTNEDFSGINEKMDKTKRYEFSFWAKASATTTITAALENSVDITKHTWATANQEYKNYLWQDTEIGTTWKKYTFDIDPSSQPYDVAENVYIKLKMVPNSIVDIWIDEFTLTEKVSQVNTVELYSNRNAFSFEDPSIVGSVWGKWENDGAATMTVVETGGANNTSNSLELAFTSAGEVQVYTNGSSLPVNASIDKNKKYIYSFWAKASETTTITAALENPNPWVSLLWQDQEIGTSWVKYSFEIDPSTKEYTGSADNVYVKIKMAPTNGNIKIWLDEFSLIEVGSAPPVTDGYANRDIFSFQSEAAALASWKSWSPEATSPATLSVDASTGANGTSSSGKVSFTALGKELQLFTNEDFSGINAKMDKNKMYEFSFWAKASAATTITAALENSVDITKHTWATENQEWKGYLWQDTEIGTTWTKYTFDIDPSGQPYDTAENVYVKIKMVPNALVDIWFDEFSLKEK